MNLESKAEKNSRKKKKKKKNFDLVKKYLFLTGGKNIKLRRKQWAWHQVISQHYTFLKKKKKENNNNN